MVCSQKTTSRNLHSLAIAPPRHHRSKSSATLSLHPRVAARPNQGPRPPEPNPPNPLTNLSQRSNNATAKNNRLPNHHFPHHLLRSRPSAHQRLNPSRQLPCRTCFRDGAYEEDLKATMTCRAAATWSSTTQGWVKTKMN